MTGFAAAAGSDWRWEARSVNHRGLDLRLRLPAGQDALEPLTRKAAQARLQRGSVTLELWFDQAEGQQCYRVNEAWLDELTAVAERRGGGGIAGLLGLRGVIEAADAEQGARDETALLATLEEALDGLVEVRRAEGRALAITLDAHLLAMKASARAARVHAAAQPGALQDRLAAAVASLDTALPEERLAQEIALLAAKADVREELDRLDAHLEAVSALLASGEAVGRRLDFLCQEIHREANTLGSKSATLELTRIVLDLKAAIEAFREQARNVE
ncbi:MAG: YicC family protein [Alphaproteobacteria bacterium]|nr:YicC family protein [Alphaproteobacteria bacterium]MCY4230012.1 YicC family protein [Alphaproteobacteria bacterium]MCY4319701.1 YicC family protein [Alphaproteobacteria bacterium]